MKRCPHCKRTYSDESLKFCLDDGSVLLDGPGTGEDLTEIFRTPEPSEGPTKIYDASAKGTNPPAKTADRAFDRLYYLPALGGLVVIAVIAGIWFYRPAQTRQLRSIAVMPFSNETGATDAEYLSDGITDALINSLTKIQGLNVKARSTVFDIRVKT